MLKWLEKVISRQPAATVTPNAQPAPQGAADPQREPPLPPPTIHLDPAPIDDVFAQGILSRQVIIDRAYHPVAYEFGLRRDNVQRNLPAAPALGGLIGRLPTAEGSSGRRTWLRLADAEFTEALVTTLDHSRIVLVAELSLTAPDQANAALAGARQLRAAGFQLALGDWQDTAPYHAWLPLCDYVEIRNKTQNPMELGRWPEKLNVLAPNARLVACDVDSWEELEYCHRQNYQLFRGQFLTRRENWPRQPKIHPDRTRLIDLLNRLQLGAELFEIADQLKQSPELSYRLLRYINSAEIGTAVRIGSIHQGLIVLGRDKVYRWLTVLLFTGGQAKSLDNALLEQALVRARLMELTAGDRFTPVQIDEMFVVGVFSLLDMLLQLPMSVALEPLKLPEAVETTLLPNAARESAYAPYLNLAIACEEGDRETLKALAAQLAIPLPIINSLHLDALVWTQKTLMEK